MEMTEILAISNLPVSATALLLCTDQSTLTGHSALLWVPFLVVSSLSLQYQLPAVSVQTI